uniref:CRIB domain-containing protein n=1 Tax=Mola mola TaxID=94237 RepID=A0A3Q3XFS0_MOLML
MPDLQEKKKKTKRGKTHLCSSPLGDFRHTMHIGRGGDAFGDTSFLSTLGPSTASSELGSPGIVPADDPQVADNHNDLYSDAPGSPENLQHSESVSSFTLDLDLDLGPSMLGDVLGVMDVHGAPLHRCDGGTMLLEVCHRPPSLQFQQEQLGVTV